MRRQGLVQFLLGVLALTPFTNHLIGLIEKLLPLVPKSCCLCLFIILVNAPTSGWDVRELQVLPQSSFIQQMISSCDVVVPVCLDAFVGVILFKVLAIDHHLVDCVVDGHTLLPWVQT
jgi:hypothetical protein